MSGHSKWSKIKRSKGKEDQKRGAIFSKLARDIIVAVQKGKSGDVRQNPALAQVVQHARSVNMPKVNIDRAIAKALSGSKGGGEEIVLEGYGPFGVAVMVTIETDNRQRTTAEIRSIFSRFGGSLGAPGSAGYMFKSGVKIALNDGDKMRFKQFMSLLKSNGDVRKVEHTVESL